MWISIRPPRNSFFQSNRAGLLFKKSSLKLPRRSHLRLVQGAQVCRYHSQRKLRLQEKAKGGATKTKLNCYFNLFLKAPANALTHDGSRASSFDATGLLQIFQM